MTSVYELWRQDDNGNQYKMLNFDERLPALAAALEFTARGHRQLYRVVGPPGPAVRTSADLRELCRRIPDVAGDRDLRTYLLAQYRLGRAIEGESKLAPETFGALLLAAATAQPAQVHLDADVNIPPDGPYRYEHWRRVILAQAAGLADDLSGYLSRAAASLAAGVLPALGWGDLIDFARAGQAHE